MKNRKNNRRKRDLTNSHIYDRFVKHLSLASGAAVNNQQPSSYVLWTIYHLLYVKIIKKGSCFT